MAEIRLYELGDEESNIYMNAFEKASSGSQEQAGIDAVQAYRDAQKPAKKKKSTYQKYQEKVDKAGGY